jgi:DNA replication protein DnaC
LKTDIKICHHNNLANTVATWHQYIDDNTIADAILDRIIHQAIRINLEGESMRKRPKNKIN